MAEVPYTQGVGGVNPETNVPNDYQHINATPDAFGASIGQGLQHFGAGIEKQADFYNKAVVDSTYNDAAKKMGYVVHGDPNKTITGPDGSTQIDTGFLGRKERDAMDARPSAEQQIEQIIEDGKKNLQTPQQQHEFETSIRRLQNQHIEQIGSHTNHQSDAWYASTNKSSADLVLSGITRNVNDFDKFHQSVIDLQNVYLNQVRLEGGGAVQVQDAIQRASRDATRARIEGVSVNDPSRAFDMVEKNKDTLGVLYQPLAMQMKARADTAFGDRSALEKMGQARANMPLNDPGHPVFTQVTNSNQGGFSSGGLARLVQIESGGKANAVSPGGGYTGLTQMGEAEFKKYGPPGGSRDNPQDSLYAANNYAKSNGIILAHNIGKPPTDADLYLAHQQGAGGASELLRNPNALAVDMVGEKAVTGNVPASLREQAKTWTSVQFTNYWADRFNQTQAPSTAQTAGIPTLGQGQVSGVPTITAQTGSAQTPQAINQGLDFMRQHAMQSTMDDLRAGTITQDQANHTFNAIDRDYRVQKVAEDSNEKLKTQLQNKAASDLYLKMLDPAQSGNIIQDIRTNKDLGDNWQLRHQLEHLATHPDADKTTASPQYLETLGKVTSGQIDSMPQLYQMQIDGQLKQRDVDELSKAMMHMQNDPAEKELQTKKKDALKGIETKIAYFGLEKRPFSSDEGRAYFNSNVVNNFETQFKQFRKTEEGKKDPYKFFDDKNIQKFIQSAPEQGELGVAALKDATSKNVPVQSARETTTIPEEMSKLGVTDYGWKQIINSGPIVDGKVVHIQNWDKIVAELIRSPDDASIADFNMHLSPYGVTAQDILKKAKSTGEMQGLYKGQAQALARSGL